MTKSFYFESRPLKLSKLIFNLYQYVSIDLEKSPGIMMEDGCHEFMFLREKDVCLKIDGYSSIKLPKAFSAGKITRPYKFQYPGEFNLFAIKLQPWVARHFFPFDAPNQVIDLKSLYGSQIELLRQNIFDSTSFEEKIELVETFFADVNMPSPDIYKLAMEICKRIYSSKGIISVNELMREFSESRQKINRDFLFHTKFSIKEFSIFVKIKEAIKVMHKNPDRPLTEIAYQFDYFDQSHFNRDIKRVTGVTPTFLFNTENLFKEQLKKD